MKHNSSASDKLLNEWTFFFTDCRNICSPWFVQETRFEWFLTKRCEVLVKKSFKSCLQQGKSWRSSSDLQEKHNSKWKLIWCRGITPCIFQYIKSEMNTLYQSEVHYVKGSMAITFDFCCVRNLISEYMYIRNCRK